MSRLTDDDYLHMVHSLRVLWLHDNGVFAAVLPVDQWRVHDFFRPSENLTDKERLEHRHQISKERPTLPNQAGRALARIHQDAAVLGLYRARLARDPQPSKLKPEHRKQVPYNTPRNITVRAVVKPIVDTKKLAKALLDLARDPDYVAWWNESHNEDGSWKEGAEAREKRRRRRGKRDL
jgi:hypothetical protein